MAVSKIYVVSTLWADEGANAYYGATFSVNNKAFTNLKDAEAFEAETEKEGKIHNQLHPKSESQFIYASIDELELI